MAKAKRGGFMAGFVPKVSKEPSVMEIYNGCSTYEYIDEYDRRKFVMANKNGSINNGTVEAMRHGTIEALSEVYNLKYIMTVGEVK